MGLAAALAGGLVVLSLVCFATSLAVTAGSLSPQGGVGIRTRATRASDQAWYVGHRAAQPVLRLTGLLALVGMAVLLVAGAAAGPRTVVLAGLASYAVVVALLLAAAATADRAARRSG